MTFMNKTIIYTDGSSRGNPGRGGWGALVISKDKVIELGDREEMTTNNRMELTGAIKALSAVHIDQEITKSTKSIVIYSDSQYVIKGITEWIEGWQRNGWRNSQKKAVLNRDLWERLLEVTEGKKIDWKYVKGHADNHGNIRCDEIATEFADGEKVKLFSGSREKYPFTSILKNVL